MFMLLIAVGVVASPMFGATDVRIEGAASGDRLEASRPVCRGERVVVEPPAPPSGVQPRAQRFVRVCR